MFYVDEYINFNYIIVNNILLLIRSIYNQENCDS